MPETGGLLCSTNHRLQTEQVEMEWGFLQIGQGMFFEKQGELSLDKGGLATVKRVLLKQSAISVVWTEFVYRAPPQAGNSRRRPVDSSRPDLSAFRAEEH